MFPGVEIYTADRSHYVDSQTFSVIWWAFGGGRDNPNLAEWKFLEPSC